jgi:hypothetical protein
MVAAKLKIEPGDAPLYIVANNLRGMIWHISGATERVERFVTDSSNTAVYGLAKERIVFMGRRCLRGTLERACAKRELHNAALEEILGRPFDHFIGGRKMTEVSIPSGKMPKFPDPALVDYYAVSPPGRPDRVPLVLWFSFHKYFPGGVIELELDDVVSDLPLERHEILPGKAGLIQLIAAGKVSLLPNGRYRLEVPIKRLPDQLYHLTFELPDGIPMPEGSIRDLKFYTPRGLCRGRICP